MKSAIKIQWNKISAKEQAHQMCRYCDKDAEYMNQSKAGRFIPVCKDHAHKQ